MDKSPQKYTTQCIAFLKKGPNRGKRCLMFKSWQTHYCKNHLYEAMEKMNDMEKNKEFFEKLKTQQENYLKEKPHRKLVVEGYEECGERKLIPLESLKKRYDELKKKR